jgi:hypothetical protein
MAYVDKKTTTPVSSIHNLGRPYLIRNNYETAEHVKETTHDTIAKYHNFVYTLKSYYLTQLINLENDLTIKSYYVTQFINLEND